MRMFRYAGLDCAPFGKWLALIIGGNDGTWFPRITISKLQNTVGIQLYQKR